MPGAPSIPPSATADEVALRERVRDPDFWLEVACWGVVIFSCLQILLFSFGRDQSIYAVVGEGILSGQVPYRDLWDFKPPGIFLIYAAAQGLLGKSMLSPRLLEVAGLVALVFAFRHLGEVFLEQRRAGVLAGALAALLHAELEFWHTAQPETFGAYLIVAALVVSTRDTSRRGRWGAWIGMGLLFGCAFVLKPPLGGGAFVCAAYLARREIRRGESRWWAMLPFVVGGAASLVPIGLCALWFVVSGGWGALRWTLFEFAPGYTQLGWYGATALGAYYYGLQEAFTRFSALALFGFIAAITMRPLHSREREGIFLMLGIIAVNVAGIAMQHKYFAYHYAATIPPLAFVAGIGLYKLFMRSLAVGPGGILGFVTFVVVTTAMRDGVRDLPQGFWYRCGVRMRYLFGTAGAVSSREELDRELYRVGDFSLDADLQVARYIRGNTASGTPVFVWGFEPAIYWLSERPPATRYIYNVPQRAQWERERARRELLADLAARPPAIIAVQNGDIFPKVTGDWLDSRSAVWRFPELSALLDAEYRYAVDVSGFDMYERLEPNRRTNAK